MAESAASELFDVFSERRRRAEISATPRGGGGRGGGERDLWGGHQRRTFGSRLKVDTIEP